LADFEGSKFIITLFLRSEMKMERVMGIEPNAPEQNNPEKPASSAAPQSERAQIRAQILGVDCPHLAQIVSKWSQLPPPAREAINQLVNTFVKEDPR
jgi:hypothetical protein